MTVVPAEETYGIGAGGWGAGWTNGQWVSDIDGTLITFDGASPKSLMPSRFGAPGDRLELTERVASLSGGRYEIVLDILAYDAGGKLANWFVDGSVAADGVPFSIAEFDLADFGAPEDKLGLAGGTGVYEIESAEYWFVGTGGSTFGPGGDPFQWNNTSTEEGISGYAAVIIDGDLSTFSVGDEEFAGFAMSFVVTPATAVPEPGAAAIAVSIAAFAVTRRLR